MRREAVLERVKLNPLGEVRMGCDAYGVIIETSFGCFDIFKEVPILIGHEDYTKHIEQSACHRYLSLRGEFGIYILDIKDQSISVYQTTIRGITNEWSKEQAIFGQEKLVVRRMFTMTNRAEQIHNDDDSSDAVVFDSTTKDRAADAIGQSDDSKIWSLFIFSHL